MSFEEYLRRLGRLYEEGVSADVSPDLLKYLGGGLALAGRDAEWIRYEEDSVLGFIDVRRNPQEMQRIARRRWLEHQANIMQMVESGIPPTQALELYMRARGTVPHTEAQLDEMLQLRTTASGTYSTWFYDIVSLRRSVVGVADLMTNTWSGITATAYLVAKAEDWENATPAEWNRAFAAGELARPVGQMVEAVSGTMQAQQMQRSTGRPVVEPVQAAEVRSVSQENRGTREQRGVSGNRGLGGVARARGLPTVGRRQVAPLPERGEALPTSTVTGSTSTAGPRGGFSSAQLAQMRRWGSGVERIFRRYSGRLSTDPTTINEIGALFRSTQRGRGSTHGERGAAMERQAAAGELATIENLLRNPRVEQVRALRPVLTADSRTADFEIRYQNGGSNRVEVTTTTSTGTGVRDVPRRSSGAATDSLGRPVDPERRTASQRVAQIGRPYDRNRMAAAIRRKIRHGQINARHPGVIVVQVPRGPASGEPFLSQAQIRKIERLIANKPYIREVLILHWQGNTRAFSRVGRRDSGLGLATSSIMAYSR